jgi:membrane-bound lytic murein transglycosylase B
LTFHEVVKIRYLYTMLLRWIFAVVFCVTVAVGTTYAADDWTPLIKRLVADNFEEKNVQALFANPAVKFEPDAMSSKLRELVNNRDRKPGTVSTYERFLQPSAIAGARSYSQKNMAALEDVEKRYCVPKEVVVAILLVETDLEGFLGTKPAFNTLASMALSTNLETIRPYLPAGLITPDNEDFAIKRCIRKSDWAYGELKALIRYASARGIDPLSIPGSIYGAIGICQFMPSAIFSFGVDADNDGHIDVFSKKDAFSSIANYLHRHGWKCGMSANRQRKIVMSYNHSQIYANTVIRVAEKLKKKN